MFKNALVFGLDYPRRRRGPVDRFSLHDGLHRNSAMPPRRAGARLGILARSRPRRVVDVMNLFVRES